MGRVVVAVVVENFADRSAERLGRLNPDEVRRVHLNEAVVDPEVLGLQLPIRLIARLGLEPHIGWHGNRVYRAAILTVQGRDCLSDISESGDEHTAIIGRHPLLAMDWVIDMKGHKLIGNPAHGGEQMIEAY